MTSDTSIKCFYIFNISDKELFACTCTHVSCYPLFWYTTPALWKIGKLHRKLEESCTKGLELTLTKQIGESVPAE